MPASIYAVHTSQQGQAGVRQRSESQESRNERRAYGYRDEAYPRLKILTAFLTRKWIIHPLESALSRYNFFRRGAPCYTNYSCFGLSEALLWWWPAW
jgi:hypothetical protein